MCFLPQPLVLHDLITPSSSTLASDSQLWNTVCVDLPPQMPQGLVLLQRAGRRATLEAGARAFYPSVVCLVMVRNTSAGQAFLSRGGEREREEAEAESGTFHVVFLLLR